MHPKQLPLSIQTADVSLTHMPILDVTEQIANKNIQHNNITATRCNVGHCLHTEGPPRCFAQLCRIADERDKSNSLQCDRRHYYKVITCFPDGCIQQTVMWLIFDRHFSCLRQQERTTNDRPLLASCTAAAIALDQCHPGLLPPHHPCNYMQKWAFFRTNCLDNRLNG